MLWIVEMIVVVVVANYVIRAIDRVLSNRRNAPTVETFVPPPSFKEPRRWNNEPNGPFKFPHSRSRAS